MIRFARLIDIPSMEAIMMKTGLATEGVNYKEWTPPVLVAEEDGKVVGLIQAYLCKPVPVMAQIAVHPDYQGHGIARQLGDAMELVLVAQGYSYYISYANPMDKRLLKGYAERNMENLGELNQFIRRIPS